MNLMSADFTVPGTTLRLPEKIAGFSRGEVKAYPTDAAVKGTAVPFRLENAEATLFIRPLDPNEKLKTAEDLVNDSLAVVRKMQARGIYSDVKVSRGNEPGISLWRSGSFFAMADGTPIVSFTHCRISKGRSVKIRLTSTGVKVPESLLLFIEELRALVDAGLVNP